jgi:hypothetical protein
MQIYLFAKVIKIRHKNLGLVSISSCTSLMRLPKLIFDKHIKHS